HFREQRREVVLPVGNGWLFARQLRQRPIEEIAEALASNVDVLAVTNDEIHRHVERIVSVLLKTKAFIKGKWQHAGTVVVSMQPNLAAEAEETAVLAINEWRVGKKRGRNRL